MMLSAISKASINSDAMPRLFSQFPTSLGSPGRPTLRLAM